MSFSLTDAYPIFQFNQQNVDEKYLDLFSIDHVVNKLEGDNIISTSLYFGPHYSDTLEEWEKRYIKPIIENIVFLPDGWHYEIFISPDCEKYIDRIKHPKIQFNIMKHNSTNAIPGMLWRYIPMKYSEKIIAFVGMDTPQLPHPNYIHFLNTGYKLIRWGGFVDINEHELFVYKPIQGSFLCKIEDPNIEYAMGAWIQSESHRIEISKNKTSTTINFRHVLYEGKKHKVFGTQSENCYGQDEVFLSCYLYPQYKDLSVCLINGGNHKKSAKNTAFDSDISSIKSPTIIYLNPKNSEIPKIEIKKTNICFLGSIGTSGYAIATTNFIFNYLQNNYNVTFIPRFVDNSKFDHSDIITTSVNRCKSQLYNRYDYFIINFVPDQFKNLYNEYVMYKKCRLQNYFTNRLGNYKVAKLLG